MTFWGTQFSPPRHQASWSGAVRLSPSLSPAEACSWQEQVTTTRWRWGQEWVCPGLGTLRGKQLLRASSSEPRKRAGAKPRPVLGCSEPTRGGLLTRVVHVRGQRVHRRLRWAVPLSTRGSQWAGWGVGVAGGLSSNSSWRAGEGRSPGRKGSEMQGRDRGTGLEGPGARGQRPGTCTCRSTRGRARTPSHGHTHLLTRCAHTPTSGGSVCTPRHTLAWWSLACCRITEGCGVRVQTPAQTRDHGDSAVCRWQARGVLPQEAQGGGL